MFPIRRVSLLLITAGLILLSGCRETAFERAHDHAVAENPAGVELRIATIGGAKTFQLPYPVKIEELFTAKYPNQWHIEILDGWNQASVSDEADVSDGRMSFVAEEGVGIVCCDSRHAWLDLDPLRIPSRLAQRETFVPIRIWEPGKYEFYITSYRVFSKDQSLKTYDGRGYAVTSSNILRVEVTR